MVNTSRQTNCFSLYSLRRTTGQFQSRRTFRTPDIFHIANTSPPRSYFTCRCIIVLFATPLWEVALKVLHKQQQTISLRSNIREWTHVPLASTSCLYRCSFCETDISSGLAKNVTLIWVSRERLGEAVRRVGQPSALICFAVVTVSGLHFKWYTVDSNEMWRWISAVNLK